MAERAILLTLTGLTIALGASWLAGHLQAFLPF